MTPALFLTGGRNDARVILDGIGRIGALTARFGLHTGCLGLDSSQQFCI